VSKRCGSSWDWLHLSYEQPWPLSETSDWKGERAATRNRANASCQRVVRDGIDISNDEHSGNFLAKDGEATGTVGGVTWAPAVGRDRFNGGAACHIFGEDYDLPD
jgi:hypothetical protein